MKRTICILLALIILACNLKVTFGQDTPGTVKYPTALDSQDSLFRVANNAHSTLSSGINNSVTSLTVADSTGFPTTGQFTIDSEIIYYTANNTGTGVLSGLIRGRDGTTGASHSSGATVSMRIIRDIFDARSTAIRAIQTRVGINGAGSSTPIANSIFAGDGVGTSSWLTTPQIVRLGIGAAADANALLSLNGALLSRRANASLIFGAPDAASPVSQTISVQSVVAGTTNTAGVDWNINASQGTGTGAGGKIIFGVAPAGSTGSSQNSIVTAFTIDSQKNVIFQSATVNEGVWSSQGAVTYLFQGAHSAADTSTGGTGGNLSVALQSTRTGGAQGNGSTVYGFETFATGKNDIYNIYGLSRFSSNMTGYASGSYNHHAGRFYVIGSPTNIPGGANVHLYGIWAAAERTVSGIRPVAIQADCNNNVASDASASFSSIDTCMNIATNYTGLAHSTSIIYSQGAKETSAYIGWHFDPDAIAQAGIDFTSATTTLEGTIATSGTAVTGTGTKFLKVIVPGDQIKISSVFYTVVSITDDTHLTLASSAGTQAGPLTATKTVQPIWLANSSYVMASNAAGTAKYRVFGITAADSYYFDVDARGVDFWGTVNFNAATNHLAQTKITRVNSTDSIAASSLLLENPSGSVTTIYATFNNVAKGTIRWGSDGSFVLNSVANNYYWNQDYGGRPIFNSLNGPIVFAEGLALAARGTTPSGPASSSESNIYVKGGKIVFQYNDAGTVRYKYLDMTGTGVTFVHSTTAP